MTRSRSWARPITLAILVGAALSTVLFGYRTYRSFQLLQSAYAVGVPKTSSVRGWMTIGYVAANFGIPASELNQELGLPANADSNRSLKAIADEQRISPPQYVQRVQRAIAARAPPQHANPDSAPPGVFGTIGDQVLTAFLTYGYAALGLVVLFASIGLPFPDGLIMALAGSLAAQGRINWVWAGTIAVFGSVLGDLVGYGVGRMLSEQFLEKRGQWIGYTPLRRARVHALFEHWGLLTVFITRTFVSYLSSVANLFAGVSGFRTARFLAVAIVGRVLWTAGYMGLGYMVGSDLDAATAFLTNLSLLIVSAGVLAGSGWVTFGPARQRG